MYIARARAQVNINTGVEINICSFLVCCQFSSVASVPPSELSFWDSICGAWNERAGELALYWVICISLCQSTYIKTTLYDMTWIYFVFDTEFFHTS